MDYILYVEPYRLVGVKVRISIVLNGHILYEHTYEDDAHKTALYNMIRDKTFRLACKKFRFYTTLDTSEQYRIKKIERQSSSPISDMPIVNNEIVDKSAFIIVNRNEASYAPYLPLLGVYEERPHHGMRYTLDVLLYRYNDLFRRFKIEYSKHTSLYCRILENHQYRLYQRDQFNFYTITTDTVLLALTYLSMVGSKLSHWVLSKYLTMDIDKLAETLAFEYISQMT